MTAAPLKPAFAALVGFAAAILSAVAGPRPHGSMPATPSLTTPKFLSAVAGPRPHGSLGVMPTDNRTGRAFRGRMTAAPLKQ